MRSRRVSLFTLALLQVVAGSAQGLAVGPVTELLGPGDFTGPSTLIDFDAAADAAAANTLYLAQGVEFQNPHRRAPVPIVDWRRHSRA